MRALILVVLILASPCALAQELAPPAALTPSPPLLQRGGTPPDPTILTTQQSEKAVAALKELMETRIIALQDEMKRMRDAFDWNPAAIIAEIAHLQALMDEKFDGVAREFLGRDTALAAALLAQVKSVEDKDQSTAEAIAKSEAGTARELEGLTALIATQTKSGDDNIEAVKALIASQKEASDAQLTDLKLRVTQFETQRLTTRESTGDTQANWMTGVGVIGGIVGAISILGTIILITRRPDQPAVVASNGYGNGNGRKS